MIVTRHNDNRRTGAYLSETALKPANVGQGTFGRTNVLPVLGAVYAQPLVAPGINVNGTATDVLVVATMHNMVYGFNAATGSKLWEANLGNSVVLPNDQIGPSGYRDMEWEVGIISTPVVDTARQMLWVVATTSSGGTISHSLFKLDVASGATKAQKQISAQSGSASFVSHRQLQRSSLLLSNSRIYMAFASYGDATPYNGWVLSYDADTLAQTGVFCVTPNGEGMGGIWQAGEGLCADDAGNIYFLTGNGAFASSQNSYGDCAVKLDPDLKFKSFFSPFNNQELDRRDLDLGSGGLMAIPDENMVIGGGKEAKLYLMDMNNLGGYDPKGDHVLQEVNASSTDGQHHIHGTPVFWHGSNNGAGPERRIYVWTENDSMKAFRLDGTGSAARLTSTPVAQTTVRDPNNVPGGTRGMPGGFMSVSANGTTDGIIWALHPWNEDLNQRIGQGVLRAFDATTLRQAYSSKQNVGRDDFGNLAKFCPPTIWNGHVYVATMGGIERKVILQQPLQGTPVLVSRGSKGLLVAWSGTGKHLNLMPSSDGLNWSGQYRQPNETTNHSLALDYNSTSDTLFMAWTGTDGHLNVMPSTAGQYSSWQAKTTLDEKSGVGPALICGAGRLMLAWTGTDGRLNFQFSSDGKNWFGKKTLSERCPTEPSLSYYNGNFFLLWNGTDRERRLNLMAFDKDGNQVRPKKTYSESSNYRPALVFDGDGRGRFSWVGRGNLQINEALLSSSFDLEYKRTFDDTAPNGPALCLHNDTVFITWAGTGGTPDLNVAELSRGGISLYGELPPHSMMVAKSDLRSSQQRRKLS